MTDMPLPPAADAGHLTEALRRAGVLDGGSVAAVVVESARPTVLSRIIRLRLEYAGAAAGAPASLILKTAHPDRTDKTWGAGRHEVAFYSSVAPALPPGVVPRCFEAAWDEPSNAWHLLLEDLSETHAIVTVWPLPPSREQCETILAAFARFHAAWWDDPRLGVSVGTWREAADIDAHLRTFAEAYQRFADHAGDRLSPERRRLYERLIAEAPRLSQRYRSRRNLSIMHGDSHVWNCLLPRDGGEDVRLFDWDSWRIGAASDDLAYMMALHWYPERRRELERPLLDHYHAALTGHGVAGYDRAALDADYRYSVLWMLLRPVWQASYGIPPVIWWNNLERTLLAVDDLGCAELLG